MATSLNGIGWELLLTKPFPRWMEWFPHWMEGNLKEDSSWSEEVSEGWIIWRWLSTQWRNMDEKTLIDSTTQSSLLQIGNLLFWTEEDNKRSSVLFLKDRTKYRPKEVYWVSLETSERTRGQPLVLVVTSVGRPLYLKLEQPFWTQFRMYVFVLPNHQTEWLRDINIEEI